jgi:hypothetical protein
VRQSSTIVLAAGPINPSGDTITIQLIAPADMPAVVRIVWPAATSVVQPAGLAEVTASAMKILASASTRLNQIRAQQ